MLRPYRIVRSSLALVAALAATFAGLSLAEAKDLRVGVCKRDITPISPSLAPAYTATFGLPAVVNHSEPVYLAGFDTGRTALGYHDQIWARGVVIDGDGGRIAVVSIDVVGYGAAEVALIRALVSPSSKIDYTVVTSTHNHEGPDTVGLWGANELTSGIDYGYLDFINTAVAGCIDEAANHLVDARVKFATANTAGLSLKLDPEDDGFGVADGKVLAGDAADAPETGGRIVDPRLGLIQLETRGAPRSVIATVANFGSHPESLGSDNRFVTADFPHYVRKRLEAEYGGMAMWVAGDLGVLQGPLGIDVLDPITNQPAARRTFRFAEVHATQLAERGIAALSATSMGHPAPKISYASTSPVAIPLDNPLFRFFFALGVLDGRRPLYTGGVADPSVGFPFPGPFAAIPQALGADVHTEVGAIRIGEASFGLVPTELDPQIGNRYRAQMTGAKHTFLIGLANDHIGYQVPFEKWDGSCHACAPFVLAGVPQFCPIQPIDCGTVFANNVGQGVDVGVSAEIEALIGALH